MSPAGLFKLAIDLLNQAEAVRADHPDVAAALEAHSESLLLSIAGLSVADVAELLGQSRPTIYEWIKEGYLVSQEAGRKGMSISPRSLMLLVPILDQWGEEGRQGRPSRLFRKWFESETRARQQDEASGARVDAGLDHLRPPRRASGEPAGAR
jgi:excisionase family DNA binding protein